MPTNLRICAFYPKVTENWRLFRLQKPALLWKVWIFCLLSLTPVIWAQGGTGVTDKTIRLGSLLPLEGDLKDKGLSLKAGMEAALANQTVQGRRVELLALNDFYDPKKAIETARQLIDQDIFLMIGNHGTPTVKAVLPILAESKIPLLGPYTGAALTAPGDILNVRTSYANEVSSVIKIALGAGIKPNEICAYVQNDSYGMSGLQGIQEALENQPGAAPITATLEKLINLSGDNPVRDNMGPVGVYQRETLNTRTGYQSLKKWEETNNVHCRLVVTVGTFPAIAKFIA